MTQLYTGTPYKGQNNMTAQGCFHASVNYGEPETKTLALEGLKVLMQHVRGQITSAELHSQSSLLETRLNTLPTEEQAMLAWAIQQLRTL